MQSIGQEQYVEFGIRLPEEDDSKLTRIIVVRHKEEMVGIIVDRVNKVTQFSDNQSPPERIGGGKWNYFMGIGLSAGGLVGILKLGEVWLHE